jgi:hypothetical protein
MITRALVLMLSIAIASAPATFATTAKDGPPRLPQSAKTAAGLVVKPWTIISTADGDLNKDGKPDAAVVAKFEDDKVRVSRLIVALRDPACGLLQVAEESDTASMISCGAAGSPPALSIKNNVLLVQQECGSRTRFDFTHKYQLRKGKWLLIGFEGKKVDTMAPSFASTIDVNFVTGEVAAALLEDGRPKKSERFLEIRASRIQTTGPGITDWAVPRIVIRPLTKTASAIATQAVYNNKHLFIRTQYDPPGKATPHRVSLLDSAGKTIAPLDSAVTPYGYFLESYDLSSPDLKKAVVPVTDWFALEGDTVMRLTLEVQPDAESPAVVRTSRKSPGAVLLSRSHEPIALDNINVETDPLPHPFLFKLPTE